MPCFGLRGRLGAGMDLTRLGGDSLHGEEPSGGRYQLRCGRGTTASTSSNNSSPEGTGALSDQVTAGIEALTVGTGGAQGVEPEENDPLDGQEVAE